MTETQQNIIDSLVKEFEVINEKTLAKGNLIDIAGILSDIQKDEETIRDAEINNKIHKAVLIERVKSDFVILNEDLKQLGLYAELELVNEAAITIRTPRCQDLRIRYNLNTVHKPLLSGRESVKIYQGFDAITCYIDSPHRATRFESLKDLTSCHNFKQTIRSRYETMLKSK
jgi:hypothetical protein